MHSAHRQQRATIDAWTELCSGHTYHCAPWDVTAAVMWVAFRDHTTFVYDDKALLPSTEGELDDAGLDGVVV